MWLFEDCDCVYVTGGSCRHETIIVGQGYAYHERKGRDGAEHTVTLLGGRLYTRIPYPTEEGVAGGDFPAECGDCDVGAGMYHHAGCDLETCPACGGQLLSCPCWAHTPRE